VLGTGVSIEAECLGRTLYRRLGRGGR